MKLDQESTQSMLLRNTIVPLDKNWTVTPITLGRRIAKSFWFNYLEGDAEPLEIAYRVWLLRNGDNLILVDTGPPIEEAITRGITEIKPIDQSLRALSIDPQKIRHIVLTHLHWDHASSADLFPNANFYTQQEEIDFFTGDAWENHATARFFSHRKMLQGLIDNGKVIPINGDICLCSGVRLIRVGGHTPGSQILAVQTAKGTAILAGDAIPLNKNYTEAIPTGILVDLMEVISTRKRIRAMKPHCLFTGHDPVDCLILDH